MARTGQTFHKRQRENKLREKAQLKRERRQQRQLEKKGSKGPEIGEFDVAPQLDRFDVSNEDQPDMEPSAVSSDAGKADPFATADGPTSHSAADESAPQIGGSMAAKLFVGNLPRTATDDSLSDFVTNAGFRVASAVVVRDRMTGDPRGFGFVELAEGEDIQRAIGGLDGQSMEGRRLTVNEARPQRTGFSGPRGGGGGGRSGSGRDRFSRRRDY